MDGLHLLCVVLIASTGLNDVAECASLGPAAAKEIDLNLGSHIKDSKAGDVTRLDANELDELGTAAKSDPSRKVPADESSGDESVVLPGTLKGDSPVSVQDLVKVDPSFLQDSDDNFKYSATYAFYYLGNSGFILTRIGTFETYRFDSSAVGLVRAVDNEQSDEISLDLDGKYPTAYNSRFKMYRDLYIPSGGAGVYLMLFESVEYKGHFLRWYDSKTLVDCTSVENGGMPQDEHYFWMLSQSLDEAQPLAVQVNTINTPHHSLTFSAADKSAMIK